jgi:hypothetical protein
MIRSALACAFVALLPGVAAAQIALVHVTSCGAQTFPASTCAVPATGSGNLIVVAWSSSWGTTPTVAGVSDNAGNIYADAGNARALLGTSDMVDIWYAKNSKAGATTLTISPNPAGTSGGAVIWEFSNVDTVAPLDQTSVLSNQPATVSPSGSPVTTTAPGEVIISTLVPGGSTNGMAAGNNFTSDMTFFGNGWAHLITSSAGTYASQWNTTSGAYASSTVSFKAATSSTSPVTFSACDLNQDGQVNVVDVQLVTNMYLGIIPCTANIAGAGVCSTQVIQTVQNAALGSACVTAVTHTSTLRWNASTTAGVGYNVYRASTSGGPYAKLTSAPVSALTYVDSSVLAGQTYFYVTTAIDGSGNESVNSNQVTATIPVP